MSQDDRAVRSGHPSGASFGKALGSPRFDHLADLTGPLGVWEHAEYLEPRVEHGFCTDDNARALIVVSRQHSPADHLIDLASTYLSFVLDAQTENGRFHNRRDANGAWTDEFGSEDSEGRAWWALGTVARFGPVASMRQAGEDAFETCASFESDHLRANAYAALGAAEMLAAHPGHAAAVNLLERTSGVIADAAIGRIPWPEPRLSYDNARLTEALLVAGATLGRRRLIVLALRLLEWLVTAETNGNHFSFAPAAGWTHGDSRPAFDQQPIEAWAMADACRRAWHVTGDGVWRMRALKAGQWLMGHNDTGMVLYDESTGGTSDGLMEHSINHNRGAESTIAGIGALQAASRHDDDDEGLLVH